METRCFFVGSESPTIHLRDNLPPPPRKLTWNPNTGGLEDVFPFPRGDF